MIEKARERDTLILRTVTAKLLNLVNIFEALSSIHLKPLLSNHLDDLLRIARRSSCCQLCHEIHLLESYVIFLSSQFIVDQILTSYSMQSKNLRLLTVL